ncbi:MAG: hypothetical protein ACI9JO_001743 [Psychrobacter okhotskensis]
MTLNSCPIGVMITVLLSPFMLVINFNNAQGLRLNKGSKWY